MKLAKFTYTDLKGKTSQRTLLVTSEPSDKVSGIDLSELDEVTQAEFSTLYENLYKDFLNSVDKLKAEYDVNHRYRQFFPDKMTNLELQD